MESRADVSDQPHDPPGDREPGDREPGDIVVLVIEDDAPIRRLLQVTLEDEGYRTVLAEDGETGLRALDEGKPDLILVDIGLPGIDGYAVLKQIRERPEMEKTPVFAVTAHVLSREQEQIAAAGFSELILKPIDVDRMIETIERALRQARPD